MFIRLNFQKTDVNCVSTCKDRKKRVPIYHYYCVYDKKMMSVKNFFPYLCTQIIKMQTFRQIIDQFPIPLFLAPMESVTDLTFRMICKKMGADILVSEFISSDALVRNVSQSVDKLNFSEEEHPIGIQIFGHNESSLIEAAQIAESAAPDFIDINWGCPVKKVVSKGAGSAILKDIPKMVYLTEEVVKHVKLPVTVKTRLGWDYTNKPIVEVVERMQDIGVQGITIHGRTRSQFYSGTADWSLIGEVMQNPRLQIPVIGNGDIDSGPKAIEYKQRYGVDGIMIGRAAIGNPWIFNHVKKYIGGIPPQIPTLAERIGLCLEHLRNMAQNKNEKIALLEMRRHYAGYFKAIPFFKPIKLQLMAAEDIATCEAILKNWESQTKKEQI